MNKINYQKQLEKIIKNNINNNIVPTLLLHACCAPCSSYCLEYLSKYFCINVFYYNPNITEKTEYEYRLSEEKRLISTMKFVHPVKIIEGNYNSLDFFEIAKGYEKEQEGAKRCERCFRLRLSESAKKAKEIGADFFTTTLTISPLKNAQLLNKIGYECAKEYGVNWLCSDFKKKEGYKRSIVLSEKYNLYRQNYCGCVFSKEQKICNENEIS